MKILTWGLLLFLAGCGLNPMQEGPAALVTPEVDKQVIHIDPRLMIKCQTIDDILPSGAEEDIVAWSKKVLSKAKDCREDQHKAVDFLQNTFKEQK